MLLRLINCAGQRKVDSGLKMLIKPIYYWLVASQYYKKIKKGTSFRNYSAGSFFYAEKGLFRRIMFQYRLHFVATNNFSFQLQQINDVDSGSWIWNLSGPLDLYSSFVTNNISPDLCFSIKLESIKRFKNNFKSRQREINYEASIDWKRKSIEYAE